MTVSPYGQLKRNVIISAASTNAANSNLNDLKNLFKDVINSPRRFEQIRTLKQLLVMLETRDILSEEKVEALKQIAEKVANAPELMRKIAEYENSYAPRNYVENCVPQKNIYHPKIYQPQENINQASQPSQGFLNMLNNPLGSNLSARKIQIIYETVTEEIGGHWKQLARNLNIKECYIDVINQTPGRTVEKAEKVIQKFCRNADPQRWFFKLCEALEKTHRSELSRSLQEIMAMNI